MEGFKLTITLFPLLILFSSKAFKHKIIQWNGRGLKPSLYGFRNIIQLFCFQETFFVPDDNISFKGFTIYNTDCLKPIGGASILLKSFPQRKIDLQAELHATVVTLDREITICFVNIPQSFSLNSQHLDNLLPQLPSPYIIFGDFTGHNILWDGQNNDSRGELIENFTKMMTYVL